MPLIDPKNPPNEFPDIVGGRPQNPIVGSLPSVQPSERPVARVYRVCWPQFRMRRFIWPRKEMDTPILHVHNERLPAT